MAQLRHQKWPARLLVTLALGKPPPQTTWLSDRPAVNLPAWAGWLYWINPLSYALRALVLNEFEAPRWHKPSPYDPARSLGTFILDTFNFNHAHW